jgi:hypothetical protein
MMVNNEWERWCLESNSEILPPESSRRYLMGGTHKKVKAKLSLCLIKHHAMKMYKGMEVYPQYF